MTIWTTFGLYENGTKVTDTPEILFARLDAKRGYAKSRGDPCSPESRVEAEQKHWRAAETAEEADEVIDIEPKAEIEYDDFMKMQFQVGEIIACEAVQKSKETTLLPGEDRKPGKTDRFRNPETLHTRKRWLARK